MEQVFMIKHLYAVRDTVSDEFGPIQELNNHAAALRWLSFVMADGAKRGVEAGDFELYCLGTKDPITGKVTGHHVPERVIATVDDQLHDDLEAAEGI